MNERLVTVEMTVAHADTTASAFVMVVKVTRLIVWPALISDTHCPSWLLDRTLEREYFLCEVSSALELTDTTSQGSYEGQQATKVLESVTLVVAVV